MPTEYLPFDKSNVEKWTQEWMRCRYGELVDCFYYYYSESQSLKRRSYYYLGKEYRVRLTYLLIHEKNSIKCLMVHMGIKTILIDDIPTLCFVPILEVFKDVQGREESEYFPFSQETCPPKWTDKPLETTFGGDQDNPEAISSSLRNQFITNWVYLKPENLAEQFDVTFFSKKDVERSTIRTKSLDKAIQDAINRSPKNPFDDPLTPADFPPERSRLQLSIYDAKVLSTLDRNVGKLVGLYYWLGTNRNNNGFGTPSFTPVLQFVVESTSNPDTPIPPNPDSSLPQHRSILFEYAIPCPPFCPCGDDCS